MTTDSPRQATRRANLAALLDDDSIGGPTGLARLLGKPKLKSHFSALRHGNRGIGDKLAADIERAAQLPAGWMDHHHSVAGEKPAAYAPSNLSSAMMRSHGLPFLPWGAIMKGNVPDIFRAVLPDDALAPDYPAGTEIVWTTRRRAAPGRLILVQDHHGQLHARQCHQGRTPGQWLAAPANPAYLTFDSAEPGLAVVAVFKGRLEPDD